MIINTKKLSQQQFILYPEKIRNPFVSRYLQLVYPKGIEIDIKQKTEEKEYSGTIIDGFSLSGTEKKLSNATIRFKTDDKEQNIFIFEIAGTLELETGRIDLVAKDISESTHLWFKTGCKLKVIELRAAMSFLGMAQPEELLLPLDGLKEDKEQYEIQLLLSEKNQEVCLELIIQTSSKTFSIDLLGIQLNAGTIALEITRIPVSDGFNNFLNLSAEGNIDFVNIQPDHYLRYRFQLLENSGLAQLEIKNATSSSFSFKDMLLLFKQAEASEWTALVNEIPILEHLFFERLITEVNLGNKKAINRFSASAYFQQDDHFVELDFHYPEKWISLNYHSSKGLGLETFINTKNFDNHFPVKSPHITRLGVSYGFESKQFEFFFSLKTDWSFHLGPQAIALRALNFEFAKDPNTFTGSATALLSLGKIDLVLYAEKLDKGWGFRTEMAQSTQIHLKDLINDLMQLFHFEIPEKDIPDLTVHDIHVSFNTHTHCFEMDLSVSLNTPGMGPFKEGELDLHLKLSKNNKGTHDFQMDLEGEMTIGGSVLDVEAEDIGRPDWKFHLNWEKENNKKGFDLVNIVRFCLDDPDYQPDHTFPQELLDKLIVDKLEFNYQNGVTDINVPIDTTIMVSAQFGDTDHMGVLLSGRRHEDSSGDKPKWHFLFGAYFEETSKSKTFKGKYELPFVVENFWLLFNTADEEANFWPPLPDDFPHTLSDHPLKSGILAAATLNILQHGPDALKCIHQHLPKDENGEHISSLSLLVEITEKPIGLFLEAMLNGSITIPTGKGHHFEIKDAALQFTAPILKLTASGEIDFTLDHHPLKVQGALDVDTTGIDARIKIDPTEHTSSLLDLDNVHITEVDLEVGVDFEPPGARLGLIGKMYMGDDPNTKEKDIFGVVMEFVGPIPNPEYIDIEISKMDLNCLLDCFRNDHTHGHNILAPHIARAKDVALMWAEKPITLPDGKIAQPGFGLHGTLELLNWTCYLALDVHPQTGISGAAEMSPTHLGPLSITGRGKGISVKKKYDEATGEWIKIQNINIPPEGTDLMRQLTETGSPVRERQIIQPGGAVIQFNSNHSPYLNMSMSLSLFEFKVAELDATIDKDMVSFFFFLRIGDIARFKLSCTVNTTKDNPGFDLDGKFFVGFHIKFDIPAIFFTIHVDIQLGVNATLKIHQHKKSQGNIKGGFELKILGELNFFGKQVILTNLDYKVPPDALGNLSKWILHYILTGEVTTFKKKIDDGSGKNEKDNYKTEKWKHATAFLTEAKEWAAFVHADIQQLQKEKVLDDTVIQALVEKINQDTENIKFAALSRTMAIKANANKESMRLNKLRKSTGGQKLKAVSDAELWRKMEMDRMDREIKDLKDEDGKLRETIEHIWETADKEIMIDKKEDVQTQIEALKTFWNEDIGYDKKGYAPIAVDHFTFLVSKEREAHAYQAEALHLAEEQAKKIINDAHQH